MLKVPSNVLLSIQRHTRIQNSTLVVFLLLVVGLDFVGGWLCCCGCCGVERLMWSVVCCCWLLC